jgi:hypothetical protein
MHTRRKYELASPQDGFADADLNWPISQLLRYGFQFNLRCDDSMNDKRGTDATIVAYYRAMHLKI